ncbi:hypothetical protein [Paenibacillus sp. PAMC21692]|uniref:hypothetical protein n=1 Tax=Paenibacillus sp. PAMC21692 TaxID=2762320 RepID=UPI00164D5E97|nr:hypothetical protein [Paenibacillus sp. PAMC21692]QNK56599.1 hypothetical protein H7F31_29375 [Paenibacillus sp. PAMC21692]
MLGYQGWLSIDQYPYREERLAAVRQGMLQMEAFNRLLDSIPPVNISCHYFPNDVTLL